MKKNNKNSQINTNADIILSPESGIVVKLNGAATLVVSSLMLLATLALTFFRNFMN